MKNLMMVMMMLTVTGMLSGCAVARGAGEAVYFGGSAVSCALDIATLPMCGIGGDCKPC